MDCSTPGSSVHRISQLRILEWVATSFCRGSSQPRGWTPLSCIGRWVLYHWATREALPPLISSIFLALLPGLAAERRPRAPGRWGEIHSVQWSGFLIFPWEQSRDWTVRTVQWVNMWKSLAQWLVHVTVSSRTIILRSSGWTSPPPGSHPGVIIVSLCLSHAPPQPQEGMVLPLAHCCSPSMAGFVSIYFMWKSGTCENAYPGALRLVPQRCHSHAGLSSWSCNNPPPR